MPQVQSLARALRTVRSLRLLTIMLTGKEKKGKGSEDAISDREQPGIACIYATNRLKSSKTTRKS